MMITRLTQTSCIALLRSMLMEIGILTAANCARPFGYPARWMGIGSAVMLMLTFVPLMLIADEGTPDLDFNRDIRPILAENCFYCHGQDSNKRQGDLRLDLRESAIQPGAIVPGDAPKSKLVQRIHATDPETMMPPPKSNRRLSAEQKQLLERWISAGAVYQSHWAFVAPVRPPEPAVTRQD